ncbi:MAG: diguanylate cyclase [Myxococcota bacterium]|nr:diguanylate cyclase [Myxococcota bacterium]
MNQRLLIIDDAAEVHRLLESRLQAEDLILDFVDQAQAGFDRAKSTQPDLILLDVRMPEISGFELCRLLKADPCTAHIPVIFLSGATDPVDKIKGLDLGAIDYITKPFEPAELRARVRSGLRTKRFQDLLSERAQVDGLTGLWNARHLEQRLFETFSAAQRYCRPFSLLILDLDHFGEVNQRYGRPGADKALMSVGNLLVESTRTCDIVCRFGPDDFAILLPETMVNQARLLGDRLLSGVIGLRIDYRGEPIRLTASVGVAGINAEGGVNEATAVGLQQKALDALAKAKADGQNQVTIAT